MTDTMPTVLIMDSRGARPEFKGFFEAATKHGPYAWRSAGFQTLVVD